MKGIKPTNVVHYPTGPFMTIIGRENGEMYCRDMCDCGCIDKKWKINEGDMIIAFRPSLRDHLIGLTIHALQFKFYGSATLEKCELLARDFEKYPLTGI